MSDAGLTRGEILGLTLRLTALSFMSYYTVKWMLDAIDPTKKQKKAAEVKAKKLMAELGIDATDAKLTEHELMIASQLVQPDSIPISWKDIAGMESLVQELRETVILPIKKRDLFAGSALTQAPKGVLLHGPPGCGKTMIAKATAKEAGARFINLDTAILTDKWYGESQKLAGAVFTLAQKLQPCIVFIDEIDSLLRSREANDHEATAMIKAQFMQLWDGLSTDSNCTVLVMGATNRPKDVDRAILRRMPATFHVGLPDDLQRKRILQSILRTEALDESVEYNRLAEHTKGFSGSDLRELCRTASVYRLRELVTSEGEEGEVLRAISMQDLINALSKMKESKVHCGQGNFNQMGLD